METKPLKQYIRSLDTSGWLKIRVEKGSKEQFCICANLPKLKLPKNQMAGLTLLS